MDKAHKGTPCWYELTTSDLAGAQTFYGQLFDWTVIDAGMPGFEYRLANSGGDMVAGMMAAQAPAAAPPSWMIYFAVPKCDAAVKAIVKAGGTVQQPPADVPGTGRFAVLRDPQAAPFGLLQPLDAGAGGAFDQSKPGHGCWHELMTSNQTAAMTFYTKQFGWKPGRSMDMAEMGSYDIFARGKADIGGMMHKAPGMPGPDHPFWMPYFAVGGVEATIARTLALGGQVLRGPQPIPGGSFIMIARDPQGALFAVAGPN
jgi:uncharacterized protein